jgi:hypothetical protein
LPRLSSILPPTPSFIRRKILVWSCGNDADLEITALPVRDRVAAATVLLEKVSNEVLTLSDVDLVALTALVEGVGCYVDALRVRVAGEVDARSGAECDV